MTETTYKQIINHPILSDEEWSNLGDANYLYIPISQDQNPSLSDPNEKTGKLFNASIETIMKQQLNDKLKDNTHLGDICYNAGLIVDSDFGLANAETIYSLETEPQYYNWLLLQPQNIKDSHVLNITDRTFRLPNLMSLQYGEIKNYLLLKNVDNLINLSQNNNLSFLSGKYTEIKNDLDNSSSELKTFFSLTSNDFTIPNLSNKFMKIKTSSEINIGDFVIPEHSHSLKDASSEYNNFIFDNQKQAGAGNQNYVVGNLYATKKLIGNATNIILDSNINQINIGNTVEPKNITTYSYLTASVIQYVYIRLRVSKSYTTNNYVDKGLGEVNFDYSATKPNQLVSRKDLVNALLDYELPLSFSINDIGKRVPYYKNADSNPTLIALDGTKYLIADYPDFDYETQEGFTNDGVYFWFTNIELEIKTIMKSVIGYDGEFNGYIRFALTEFPVIFNSKLIYNFLQTPQGQSLLVADGAGKDKDNFGFTILNANNFQIRMNTNFYNGNGLGRLIYGGYGMNQVNQKGAINFDSNTSQLPITEGQYLLKIQPDYMVAKIQQVGSVAGAGDLKSDRSVDVIGLGEANSNQVASMKDLKDSNIIVGNSARVITTLDSKLNQIDTNIETINNNIGVVDISGLQTQVDTNTTDIAIVESNITTLQTQTNTNTSDITNIKTVNTNQDSSISNLQTQTTTNTTDIVSVKSNITALQAQTTTNTTDIANLQAQVNTIDITGLQAQVNTNTTDITNIKTVNTNQDSSISNLQAQVNTNTTDIASINVNLLNKQQLLINIPILATRINSNLVQNVLLGTPTILGLTGYNVNDYLTVTNNIIKLKNTSYKIVNLSGSVLANFVKNDGSLDPAGSKYYQVFFRRPSTVTVAGTTANDILNTAFDIKTDNVSIADCEYTFSDSFSSGSNDPFNIDGFVFSVSNSTSTNIQTILTRTGYAKSSFIRIRLG